MAEQYKERGGWGPILGDEAVDMIWATGFARYRYPTRKQAPTTALTEQYAVLGIDRTGYTVVSE